MQDQLDATPTPHKRVPWNKGKVTGAKPPLRPKHVWSIRTKLQIEGRARDLAMFNLAIDSNLRGCDVVAIKVEDVAASGYTADRATVRQKKTGRPVRFELSEQIQLQQIGRVIRWLPRPTVAFGVPEPKPGKVESAHVSVNRTHRIIRGHVILDPRRKKTSLLTALSNLGDAICHARNRPARRRRDWRSAPAPSSAGRQARSRAAKNPSPPGRTG